MTERIDVKSDLSIGDFRRLILDHVYAILTKMKEEYQSRASSSFVKREPTPLMQRYSLDELHRRVQDLAKTIKRDHPRTGYIIDKTMTLADRALIVQTARELVRIYTEVSDLHGQKSHHQGQHGSGFSMRPHANGIYISADDLGCSPDGTPANAVASALAAQVFILAVMDMLARARRTGRSLSPGETAAVENAYRMIDRGVAILGTSQPLGISGFRHFQTYLSVSDPGDAHMRVTCREPDLLRGLVVNVEHIDRDREFHRDKVESYRLPAVINAARVRLHTGTAAPCTAFIGRPVFDSQSFAFIGCSALDSQSFARDLLKAVHLASGASTAMFMNGIVDCKFALERMTALQAIDFMRAIAGNVARDPYSQYLSAAININTSILNDRNGADIAVSERFAIARLGIELVHAGGFDKIAWDGSSDKVPADPIVGQLSFDNLLALVHQAHEVGLETYISAGMVAEHMRTAVKLGVGGVGIGTALHNIDSHTKLMGQLRPSAIRELLEIRDESSVELLGRAARLLARLDRLYFEKALPSILDPLRRELLEALQAQDEPFVLRLTEQFATIEELPCDADHPIIERAKRLIVLAHQDPIAAKGTDPARWQVFIDDLKDLVDRRDVTQLCEVMTQYLN